MSTSANLALPFIEGGELLPDVTLNETLRLIDTLVQLAIVDRDLNAPPGSPGEGQRWIVKASPSPTGAWAGHGNHLAAWQDGGWIFCTPRNGWLAYVLDEGALIAWNGTAWVDAGAMLTTFQNVALLGIGTTADATNPFSAKLNNALWAARTVAEGGDGHLRYKMSKESAAKTLSLLFQDNFSGRAEIGLTGDDDFHFKVSADGSNWLDAITIDRATGKLAANQGFGSPATTRGQLYAAPFDALAHNGTQVDGNAACAQEFGTTGSTLASGTPKYTTDMWQGSYTHGAGTAVVTSGQVAAASFGAALPGFSTAHRLKATTAITSPANGDAGRHIHSEVGDRFARYKWGTASAVPVGIAFRFYAMRSGTQMIRALNAAGDRAYHTNFAVATGWNYITKTIPGDTSGTWATGPTIGCRFDIFGLGKEASPATADAWGGTPKLSTTASDGENQYSSNNDETLVTGFLTVPGIELPDADRHALIMRPFGQELVLCRRYIEKNYDYATLPGTASITAGLCFGLIPTGSRTNGSPYGVGIRFGETKRATPTVTVYGYAGGAGKVSDEAGTDLAANSGSANHVGENGFNLYNQSGGTVTLTQLFCHWLAKSQL